MRECPYCLVSTHVSSEAPFAGYGLRRVHECRKCTREFESFELPASVVYSIGEKRVRAALGAFGRGVRRSVEAAQRAKEIAVMIGQRIAPTLIAHALGISTERVRQVRAASQERTAP